MNAKSATTVCVALLLGLTLSCNASAADERDNKAITDPIQACVAEIGERANYDGAERVVHTVESLDQKNLVEKRIKIETAVYVDDDKMAREYSVSCITGNLGKIVKFRLSEADTTVQG